MAQYRSVGGGLLRQDEEERAIAEPANRSAWRDKDGKSYVPDQDIPPRAHNKRYDCRPAFLAELPFDGQPALPDHPVNSVFEESEPNVRIVYQRARTQKEHHVPLHLRLPDLYICVIAHGEQLERLVCIQVANVSTIESRIVID